MVKKNIKINSVQNMQNSVILKKKKDKSKNKNSLNNATMKKSKKKIYKIKKKNFKEYKNTNTNSTPDKKSKNKNIINKELSIKNTKKDILVKDISKTKKPIKNHLKIQKNSKEINHISRDKKESFINEKWIKKNRDIHIKSNKLKKNEKKDAFSNINVLYKVNKKFYDYKTKKNEDDECNDFYLKKNKQKYKKKKKIEKDPEDIVNSSLFRYINEYMYTNKSGIVEKKLIETKNIFNIYHLGYKNQKSKWPTDPVNIIIKYLKKNFTKFHKIGDLGCGEAEIARTLTGWSIDSFDLIKFNEYVTACNITKLEKPDNSYDCFVLSLSLMNTDWPKIIFESVRCLKKEGTLIIADVVSRFKNYKAFIKFMNNVGFKLLNKVNLDDFFYIFYFQNNKKDGVICPIDENRIKKVSELLAPCIYKRR